MRGGWRVCAWSGLFFGAGSLGMLGCAPSAPNDTYQSYEEKEAKQRLVAKPSEDRPDEQPTENAKSTEAPEDLATTTSTVDPPAAGGLSGNSPAGEREPVLPLFSESGESVLEAREEEIPASALAPVNVVDGTNVAAVMQVRPSGRGSSGGTGTSAPSAPGQAPSAGAEVPLKEESGPRPIKLLIPERRFLTEAPRDALRVSYDDLDLLKVLNMEPVPDDAVSHFPSWLKGLDGKEIRIRGFMYPTFEATGIEQFVLARDNQICCFGRDPKVYDLVAVELRKGKKTNYIANRPFDVVGRFRIEMLAEDGKLFGLYWLEDAEVIDP